MRSSQGRGQLSARASSEDARATGAAAPRRSFFSALLRAKPLPAQHGENGVDENTVILESNPDADVQLDLGDLSDDILDFDLRAPATPDPRSRGSELAPRRSLRQSLSRMLFSRGRAASSARQLERSSADRLRAVTVDSAAAPDLPAFASARSALSADWADHKPPADRASRRISSRALTLAAAAAAAERSWTLCLPADARQLADRAGEQVSVRVMSSSATLSEATVSAFAAAAWRLGSARAPVAFETVDLSGAAARDGLCDVLSALASGALATHRLDMSRCEQLADAADDAAAALAAAEPKRTSKKRTSQTPVAQEVLLRMNGLGVRHALTLCDAMLRAPLRLQLLDLSGNPLGTDGEDHFVNDDDAHPLSQELFLCAARAVTELRLRACALGDTEVRALASALRSPDKLALRRLDLGGNPVSDAGVRALSRAIASGAPVRALDLSYCDAVSPQGCAALAEALLSRKCALRELDLRSCATGVDGCFALAEALEAGAKLRALTVGGPLVRESSPVDRVGAEGAARLLEAHKVSCALRSLVLAEGAVGSDAVFVLNQIVAAPMAERVPTLERMLLSRGLDDEGDGEQGGMAHVRSPRGRRGARAPSAEDAAAAAVLRVAGGEEGLTAMARAMAKEDLPVFMACMHWLQEAAGFSAHAAVGPVLD